MRLSNIAVPALLSAAITLVACDSGTKQQLATVAHADSIHVDSLNGVRKDLLEEMMSSTAFVNQINAELSKARALAAKPVKLDNNTELATINEERQQVVARITHLVARLDSVQNRVAATRRQMTALSQKDSGLVEQIAAYEKSMAEIQATASAERAGLQKQIDDQQVQIAALTGQVDTLNTVKTQLTTQVGDLTSEKNTAYYVIGTKDELIKKGVLVEEGSKRFLILGGRQTSPARELDPSAFTKIDRLENRTISLPEGEYKILTRQSPTFTGAKDAKDGKIAGSLVIEQPEEFWAPSRFLILVRS